MNGENENKIISVISTLLLNNGITNQRSNKNLTIATLAGDGSSRKSWRVMEDDRRLCLAVAPPSDTAQDLAEARASRFIGLHLLKKGVPVPEQYGWNEEHGVLLFEDLGDEKLHDRVQVAKETGRWLEGVRPFYGATVVALAEMQVCGADGFDPDWCWDSPCYDKTVMLERESDYFLRAFWKEYLGREEPVGLREEFGQIAKQAALISAGYFLHRDFQSRNIMMHEDRPCFIDCQGGRMGPLAYDLASLLIDPYAALPFDFQEELLDIYLDRIETLISVNRKAFVEEYLLLAMQRNLQIVGAFSFLSQQRHKVFFEQFLQPALSSLNSLAECELFAGMEVLKKTVRTAVTLLPKVGRH